MKDQPEKPGAMAMDSEGNISYFLVTRLQALPQPIQVVPSVGGHSPIHYEPPPTP